MVLEPLDGIVLKGVPCKQAGSQGYGRNPYEYLRVRIAKGHEATALARLVLVGCTRIGSRVLFFNETTQYNMTIANVNNSGKMTVYITSLLTLDRQLKRRETNE